MMHNHRAVILLCVLCVSLSLSSCNWTKPIEWVYFERVKFTFWGKDRKDQIVYLCTKEKTPEATRLKAEKANAFYMKEFGVIITAFADRFLEKIDQKTEEGDDDDGFSMMDGISMSIDLQNKTEDLIDNIEEKYQCLLIDIIDQDEND